jgi:hypothetical protein
MNGANVEGFQVFPDSYDFRNESRTSDRNSLGVVAATIAAISPGSSTSAHGLRVAPEGDGGIRRPTKTEVFK